MYKNANVNGRGQYADSVMDQLESQNDVQIEGLSAKVKMLKDVSDLREIKREKKDMLTFLIDYSKDR